MPLTVEEMTLAASLAVVAMSASDREAFIRMVEDGDGDATVAARSFAVEGARRRVHMAHIALERSNVMGRLIECVYDDLSCK